MFPGVPERDREISAALGVDPYRRTASLPEFLLHEPIGYDCDEEGQEEVEKGHGEEEAGEVSADRGDGGVRIASQRRSATLESPPDFALDSQVHGTAPIRCVFRVWVLPSPS